MNYEKNMDMMSEKEDMVICPYDASHVIRKTRIARHLTKCEQNHPSVKLDKCPYNAFHRVKPLELKHHLLTCEDKAKAMDMYRPLEPLRPLDVVSMEEINNIQDHEPPTENWDLDPEPVESYDPNKYAEGKNILRMKMCASKSEKRKFKLKERERHAALFNASTASQESTENIKPKNQEFEKPLRLPRDRAQALTRNKMKNSNSSIVSDTSMKKAGNVNNPNSIANKPYYFDDTLITFTKKMPTFNDTSIDKVDDLETTLNTTTDSFGNISISAPNPFPSGKRCSAGRGISKLFEAHKKSELKPQEVKPQEVKPQESKPQESKPDFMKPKTGINSSDKKNAETPRGYSGSFLGYDMKFDLDMQDFGDKGSSADGHETN